MAPPAVLGPSLWEADCEPAPTTTLLTLSVSFRKERERISKKIKMHRLKRVPAMQETWVRSLSREDPLEKEMATHSSILAWRIPWTEEPGGLQSTGSKESDTTERLHSLTQPHFLKNILKLCAEMKTDLPFCPGDSSLAEEQRESRFLSTIRLSPVCLLSICHLPVTPALLLFICSVQLFETLRNAARQASCPSLSPRVCSDSCPLSQ